MGERLEHGDGLGGLDDTAVLVGEDNPVVGDVEFPGELLGELAAVEEFMGDVVALAILDESVDDGVIGGGHVKVLRLEQDVVADLGLGLLP